MGTPVGSADDALATPAAARVKVVAIVGYTRSGSTLLDAILGQIPGFFSTGELHYLWERGLLEGRRCGCGRPIPACEVWSEILARAFDGGVPDPRTVMRWQDRSVRTRHTLGLLRGGRGTVDREALRAYRTLLGRLYPAIAEVTGARVVVDSSKRPSDGAVLRLVDRVDPYVVHLVRDPRAVVYSWRRRKPELDRDEGGSMPQQGVVRSAVEWTEQNAAAEALRRSAGPRRSMLVRYEDFVDRPRSTVAAIARMVGEGDAALPFDDEVTVRLGPNHTVGGNPGRFTTGTTALRRDDEWRSRIERGDRATTTALTFPLLLRYGYPLAPGRDA